MNYNRKTTSVKSVISTILLMIFISLESSLNAAEPPKLDPGKPIRFDIQLGAAQFPAGKPKGGTYQPTVLGGYIEGGKVTGAYAPNMTQVYAPGASPDDYFWDLCPYGPRGGMDGDITWTGHSRDVSAKIGPEGFSGTWSVNYGKGDPAKSPAITPEWKIRITAQPAPIGYTGTFEGTVGDSAVNGPCVIRARNVPAGMIDPTNAYYQIVSGNKRVFVEVRAGKAVQAWAVAQGVGNNDWRYRRPEDAAAATRLYPADASNLNITVTDEGLAGKAATLNGTISVTPTITVKLNAVELSGAGRSRAIGKDSTVSAARSYPLADPRMARCRELFQKTYRGTQPVPETLLAQVRQESLRDDVQPAPSEAMRYTHRLWGASSFIYAPWIDFDLIPGAVKYRFAINTWNVLNQLVEPPVASFEAVSPRASLAPIWAKVPVADGPRSFVALKLIGLDAAGKPVGEPQSRNLQRRPPFNPEMIVLPEAEVLMELALRQPHFLMDEYHSHLYLTEAVRAAVKTGSVKMEPLSYGHSHLHNTQQWLAMEESDPGRRDQQLRLLDTFNKQRLLDAIGDFKIPHHYNVVLNGVVQETGRNFLNAIEVQPDPVVLERLRLWTRYFGRLQQPSGSWCISSRAAFSCTGGFSLWGSRFLENTSASWLPFLARLRQFDDQADARALDRAMEERAASWVRNNTLRTGFGEQMHQQTDPSDMAHSAQNQIEYALYVLRHAPPSQRDVVMASDLMRRIEDRFITWDAIPLSSGGGFTFLQSLPAVEALCLLELYALDGDPVLLAKSEALAASYLQRSDPWTGSDNCQMSSNGSLFFNRFKQEHNDPEWIVRWVKLHRQLAKTPPAAIAERHLTLTLDRIIDGVDRVVLDLGIQGGKVVQSLARTPTWDGPGANFHQPGRLHTRPGKVLFHGVDATALAITPEGLSGQVKLSLKNPQGDETRSVTVAMSAKRQHARGWLGTWKQDKTEGRVEGRTLADVPTAGTQQIFVQVNEALTGGEAWQTWALAGAVLPPSGPATGTAFLNPNSGWSAKATVNACALTSETFTMTLDSTVTWDGVAELAPPDSNCHVLYKTTPDSPQACLANWEFPGKEFRLGFPLQPAKGDWDPAKPVTYTTTWKAVTAGKYRLQLTGKRLGNILYGKATITGPDGKETARQFLGDVESIKTIQPGGKP
jgi:hypothetical protein